MGTGVRIAGVGAVSCHGRGVAALVSALRDGRRGAAPRSIGGAPGHDRFPVNALPDELAATGSEGLFGLLEWAVEEACREAGLEPGEPLGDCGLLLGCANLNYLAEADWRRVRAAGAAASPPDAHARLCTLAERFGIGGSVGSVQTACSSSAVASILARERILRGDAQRMLVLGAEGLSAIVLRGFLSLLLLDPDGCRPFDARRQGLQIGEGFAALLLERDDAPSRSPLGSAARLVGGACLCDTHHLTSASPDGRAMLAVVQDALSDAGLSARQIVAVKAHGTGSPDSDAAEAAAMRSAFGVDVPPVTALKASLGHTLGACGALETAALVGCLRAGFLPACAGFEQPDEELGLVPEVSVGRAAPGAHLLDFFGFGGNYAALVVEHG